MSLYEGASLLLSTVGTLFTVYLGFRQLGRAAPEAAPARASYAAPPTPHPGYQYRPVPTPTSPYPSTPPAAWRPPVTAQPVFGAPQARMRPKPVRTASVLLFAVAALQPVVLLTYYGIEYAMNAELASADFSNAGVADIAGLGLIAVLCGILGIFVARGSRVAAWCVWAFGLLGVPFTILTTLGIVLAMVAPTDDQAHPGLLAVVAVYLMVVSIAIAWSAILLLNSTARAFFFGVRR